MSFEIGTRVDTEKNGPGRVAFCGIVQFAEKEWVGIVLDEPRGKNNGSVQDVQYFSCDPNFGLFVKPAQLKLESTGVKTRSAAAASGLKTPATTLRKDSSSRPASLRPSPNTSPKISPAVSMEKLTKAPPPKKVSSSSRLADVAEKRISTSNLAKAIPPSRTPTVAVTPKAETKVAPVVLPTPSGTSTATAADDSATVVSRVKKMEEQPITPVLTSQPPVSGLSSETEIQLLRDQNQDLTEKLATLRAKRKEDQGLRSELEHCQLKLQAMQEANSKLTEKNADIQRQLAEAKKDVTELRQWQEEHGGEGQMQISAEEYEIMMIDKEVAEESREQLQHELDAVKQDRDTIQASLNVLQQEMTGGGAPEGNSVQLKQVQEQNRLLKMAVEKLRDLQAQAEADRRDAVRDADELRSQNVELVRINEHSGKTADDAEARILEYQEQIDAAMGAEEMIAGLTHKNLTMEDKIQELERQLEDMEEMKDLDEQILEAQKQTERDLMKDIEQCNIRYHDLDQRLKEEQKHASDLVGTIRKFRDKTVELNKQIQDLNDQVLRYEDQVTGQQSEGRSMASMVNQLTQNATKTFAEHVQRQAGAVELEYAKKHIIYLQAFMPDNFLKPGGDNDAVNINILFPRLASKAALFAKMAAEKYPGVPGGTRREHVTKAPTAERWAHTTRVAFICAGLIAVCGQFESAIQCMSVEQLARLSQMQPDMAIHEKTVDSYLELLKQDRFDEHTSLSNVEKAVGYFNNIFSVHVGDGFTATHLVSSLLRQLTSGTAWAKMNVQRLVFFLDPNCVDTDIHSFAADISTNIEQCDQLLIRSTRRVPTDRLYKLTPTFTDDLTAAVSNMSKFCDLLHEACAIASNVESESDGVSSDRLKEMIHGVVRKLNGEVVPLEKTFEPFKKILNGVRSNLTEVDKIVESGSLEYTEQTEKKAYPAMLERAHWRKQAAVDAEGLRWQVDKKDAEILELKKNIKSRIEDISNYKLRLDMSEARMDSTGRQESARVTMLETELTQLRGELKKKHIEHDEGTDRLRQSLAEAEAELEELRKNQKNMSKRALLQGIQTLESRVAYGAATTSSLTASSPSTASSAELAMLEMQLSESRHAYKNIVLDNVRLRGEVAMAGERRGALMIPDMVCGPETLYNRAVKDPIYLVLSREADELYNEYLKKARCPRYTIKYTSKITKDETQRIHDNLEVYEDGFYRRVRALHARKDRYVKLRLGGNEPPAVMVRFCSFGLIPKQKPAKLDEKQLLDYFGIIL